MPRKIAKPKKLQARKPRKKEKEFPDRNSRVFKAYLNSGFPLLEVDGTGKPVRLIYPED